MSRPGGWPALLDAVFLADNIAVPEYGVTYLPQAQFYPVVVLGALAAVTRRVGLIATGSTTCSEPGDLARRFATLDQLSGGRAAWNIVTTSTPLAAANFSRDRHPPKADRYARAQEFVDAVERAWDGGQADVSAQPALADAVAFRSGLRQQAAAAGRGPGLLLVLPALMITLGGTEAEARQQEAELAAPARPPPGPVSQRYKAARRACGMVTLVRRRGTGRFGCWM